MNDKIFNIKSLVLLLVLFVIMPQAYGQKEKKQKVLNIDAFVQDENNVAIPYAVVIYNEGVSSAVADKEGKFTVKVKHNDEIQISAIGFESKIVSASSLIENNTVIIKSNLIYGGEKHVHALDDNVSYTKRNTVGAIADVAVDNLKSYPDMLISNTLQGQALGLNVQANSGGLANNAADIRVRGNSTTEGNRPIVIIDGFERDMEFLLEEEIESMQILKDATAKIIYGSRAANGVILITTKKGKQMARTIKVSTDYGVGLPIRMPEFLNSYQYVNLYDEARVNDGLAPIYSNDYDGYRNSTGENDLRYPDVDYYDYFLRNFTTFNKYSLEFSGGTEGTQYALVAGYKGATGLQDVGEKPKNNAFNVRGNIKTDINKVVSLYGGIMFQMRSLSRTSIDHSTTFDRLSSHRPNEYPLIISNEIATEHNLPISDNTHVLGGSFLRPNNLYGSLLYGGRTTEQQLNSTMNFGMNFDLDVLMDGLSARTRVSMDNYFNGHEVLTTDAATYQPIWYTDTYGNEQVMFDRLKQDDFNDNIILNSTSTLRSVGFESAVAYDKEIGKSDFNLDLVYKYLKFERKGTSQDVENNNILLHSNYVYDNKYILDGSIAFMGSNKFIDKERYFLSYALGGAWIISEEGFMQSNNLFNFLKFKASYGVLGYDASTPHFTYKTRYEDNGEVNFGEQNGSGQGVVSINTIGNPNLTWEKSREINLGFEALMFDNRLTVETNYFNEKRSDIILMLGSVYSNTYGGNLPYMNAGEVQNAGVEIGASWFDRIGELQYRVGTNFTWTKNKIIAGNFLNNPKEYSYLNRIGTSTDATLGYVSEGLFGKDVDLSSHVVQNLGQYQNGDIAYKDINHDNIINEQDRQLIGNTYPRTFLSLDVNLKYKRWGLYVLGIARFGYDKYLNNSYYWNYGENKYSTQTLDRYHATNNPTGNYPRLTTTAGDNNFRNSTFWMTDASFFRLKNLELNYTIDNVPAVNSIKLYVRTTNLFSISKIKDLDPETINGGISKYPNLMSVVGGFAITL